MVGFRKSFLRRLDQIQILDRLVFAKSSPDFPYLRHRDGKQKAD